MEIKDTPETLVFRRQSTRNHLERRITTYAQWAPMVPLRQKGASAEDVYRDLSARLDKLHKEQDFAKQYKPTEEQSEKVLQLLESQRRELPWANRTLESLFNRMQTKAARQCAPIAIAPDAYAELPVCDNKRRAHTDEHGARTHRDAGRPRHQLARRRRGHGRDAWRGMYAC